MVFTLKHRRLAAGVWVLGLLLLPGWTRARSNSPRPKLSTRTSSGAEWLRGTRHGTR